MLLKDKVIIVSGVGPGMGQAMAKIAAMEAIRRFEPCPRKTYTGSIGWLAPNGDLDLSIAIRTALRSGEKTLFAVGGAVTWDSIPEAELEELAAKGQAILRAIQGEGTA